MLAARFSDRNAGFNHLLAANPMIDNSVIGELHMITQSELKELLHYDPETGIFIRLISFTNKVKAGGVAGWNSSHGYIKISVKSQTYYAHRLAWLYIHGVWPKQIDHINHNPSDNRLVNLRETTQQENAKNASMKNTNKSGVTGIHLHEPSNKWRAYITVDGKAIHLGCFSIKNDAIKTRKEAEIKYGFHANHGR